MSQAERRLAAIMFTDMVGYTALGQRNESLSLALVEEQRKMVRPILARHNGREVKTMGDAFLVEFPSALDAARCAYDIQRAAREFNLSLPMESRLHLRIGIHVGEVVEAQGDISGDAVNVASRIEPLAEDGGVCLTRQVFDHVQNKLDLPLSSLGEVPLKNVAAPAEVFKMEMPWNSKSVAGSRPDKGRIAVLPFASFSPDPNDEYFADGLTEELITRLSEVKGLRVIARTSVMNYKRREKSVSEIGRELTVASVIEGSVRKSGNRVRITAQLVDTENEEHQWAETYDRELDDIFAIQSDVALKVADSLKVGVFRPKEKETEDLRAYMLYLRAKQLIHDSTGPSLREATSLLRQAVTLDPGFARAYAALSEAWTETVIEGAVDFTQGAAKAEENARKALELGPEWAESHAAMARACSLADRFDQTRKETETALRINPNLAEAHTQDAVTNIAYGRLESGIRAFRRAYDLDPLRFSTAVHLAISLRLAGRTAEAFEVLGKMKELYPRNPRVYSSLAECHMSDRDYAKAQEMLDVASRLKQGDSYNHLNQGVLYALTGKKEEATKEMEHLGRTKIESSRLYGRLFILAALGDLDGAFRTLDRQVELHSWPYNLPVHPLFASLREDPRYRDFLVRVGISKEEG